MPPQVPANTVVPESSRTPFYPALDGLRAFAVFGVFLVHYFPDAVPLGWVGVQAFFVLSGFLITGILFDTRHTAHRYRNFYARRTLRIFPLYYGLLIVLALIALVTHGHGPTYFWLWFAYLQNFHWNLSPANTLDFVFAGTHGFAAIGHLWSLAVEEQFYLLWPPVIFLLRDRGRLMAVCLLGIGARVLLAVYLQTHLAPLTLALGTIDHMLPTQSDGFLMGGWLALWLRGKPSATLRARSGSIAAVVLLAYTAALAVLRAHPAWFPGQDIFSEVAAFQSLAGTTLSNLVSAFLILAIIQTGTWAHRLCNLAPLRSLGRVSYGLYVFHLSIFMDTRGPLSDAAARFHVPPAVAPVCEFVIAVSLTVALSYLSFYLYEKPFLLLKNRFTSIHSHATQQESAHPL